MSKEKFSNWKWGKRSRRMLFGDPKTNRKPVRKEVQEWANLTLKYSTVDIQVIDGYRTTERQQELFKKGKTTLDGIKRLSDHQDGNATDMIPLVRDPKTDIRLNPYDVKNDIVIRAWGELHRAQLRAAMKLGIIIELGFAYRIGNGRDYGHTSYLGKRKDLKK